MVAAASEIGKSAKLKKNSSCLKAQADLNIITTNVPWVTLFQDFSNFGYPLKNMAEPVIPQYYVDSNNLLVQKCLTDLKIIWQKGSLGELVFLICI